MNQKQDAGGDRSEVTIGARRAVQELFSARSSVLLAELSVRSVDWIALSELFYGTSRNAHSPTPASGCSHLLQGGVRREYQSTALHLNLRWPHPIPTGRDHISCWRLLGLSRPFAGGASFLHLAVTKRAPACAARNIASAGLELWRCRSDGVTRSRQPSIKASRLPCAPCGRPAIHGRRPAWHRCRARGSAERWHRDALVKLWESTAQRASASTTRAASDVRPSGPHLRWHPRARPATSGDDCGLARGCSPRERAPPADPKHQWWRCREECWCWRWRAARLGAACAGPKHKLGERARGASAFATGERRQGRVS